MLRSVADQQDSIFGVFEELLMDKTIKLNMLTGQAPVLDRVKEELTNFWVKEAQRGRSIEEFARSWNCFQHFSDEVHVINFCRHFSK